MSTWFVSRHPGALDWATQQGLASLQGLQLNRQVSQIDTVQVQAQRQRPLDQLKENCSRIGGLGTRGMLATCRPAR